VYFSVLILYGSTPFYTHPEGAWGRLICVITPAPGLQLLEDAERETLRRLVEDEGLAQVARTLNLSRGVVSAAVAGIGVRRGSIELVRDALAARARAQAEGGK